MSVCNCAQGSPEPVLENPGRPSEDFFRSAFPARQPTHESGFWPHGASLSPFLLRPDTSEDHAAESTGSVGVGGEDVELQELNLASVHPQANCQLANGLGRPGSSPQGIPDLPGLQCKSLEKGRLTVRRHFPGC